MEDSFYGPAQAEIHNESFGRLAGWAAQDLVKLLAAHGTHGGVVVDLGCGSGILARHLTGAGYAVIGVDISPAMLSIARRQAPEATFHEGSLWTFDIPPCVAVTALGEALNYVHDGATADPLQPLVQRVHDSITPGGVFMFDIAVPGRTGGGVQHQFHDRERRTLYMRAEQRAEEPVLDRYITIFSRRDDDLYERTDEHHVLRLYNDEAVVGLLQSSGFDVDARRDYESAPATGAPPGWRAIVARRRTP